jgi:hypothetical protein
MFLMIYLVPVMLPRANQEIAAHMPPWMYWSMFGAQLLTAAILMAGGLSVLWRNRNK